MAPYRIPGEVPVPVPENVIEVHRDRFAQLERCAAILEELEQHIFSVEHENHRRWGWTVELYTGEYVSMYPVTVDGKDKTLQAAMEDALEWEPVTP